VVTAGFSCREALRQKDLQRPGLLPFKSEEKWVNQNNPFQASRLALLSGRRLVSPRLFEDFPDVALVSMGVALKTDNFRQS
jgi:hypothetical protein